MYNICIHFFIAICTSLPEISIKLINSEQNSSDREKSYISIPVVKFF